MIVGAEVSAAGGMRDNINRDGIKLIISDY